MPGAGRRNKTQVSLKDDTITHDRDPHIYEDIGDILVAFGLRVS